MTHAHMEIYAESKQLKKKGFFKKVNFTKVWDFLRSNTTRLGKGGEEGGRRGGVPGGTVDGGHFSFERSGVTRICVGVRARARVCVCRSVWLWVSECEYIGLLLCVCVGVCVCRCSSVSVCMPACLQTCDIKELQWHWFGLECFRILDVKKKVSFSPRGQDRDLQLCCI